MTLDKTYWLNICKDRRCHRISEPCIKITIMQHGTAKTHKKLRKYVTKRLTNSSKVVGKGHLLLIPECGKSLWFEGLWDIANLSFERCMPWSQGQA